MRGRKLVAACALVGVMVLSTGAVGRAEAGSRIRVVRSFAGRSTAEWSARWWQWAAGLPANASPLVDTADCGTGQRDPVFFLAGTLGGTASRTCHVPEGKALLVPAINAECSSLPDDCGGGATDYASLSTAVEGLFAAGVKTRVTVDGHPVAVHRVLTSPPPFQITFVIDNPFRVGAGTGSSVALGYYALIAPLPEGRHSVVLSGELEDHSFSIAVDYKLYVDG